MTPTERLMLENQLALLISQLHNYTCAPEFKHELVRQIKATQEALLADTSSPRHFGEVPL
jgi:hypothetical protein